MLLEQITETSDLPKPVLNINGLEAEYNKLPTKLKEVVPSNIKEWQNFQKQINNLWDVYLKYSEGKKKIKSSDRDLEVNWTGGTAAQRRIHNSYFTRNAL